MKKIKLLLAAMAAMFSLGAQAGENWVAPSAPAAADPVSGGVYKIRNVGAGQYLTGGAAWFSWATSAVLGDVNSAHEWTLTGSEAAGYTFACNRGGNNKLFTSGNDNAEQCMHVDGGSATTYFLEKQANGYYRLRQNGVTGKYVGGPDSKGGILAQIEDTEKYGANSCDWEFVPISALTTYGPTVAYAEMRAKVLAFVNATDVYTDQNDAAATLLAGVYAQDDVVDAATTAAEVNNATDALKTLVMPFVGAVKINDGKSFDITDYVLTNPGFELGNMNGWTQTGTQSVGAQGNKAYDNVQGNYYAERWHADGTIILSQTTSTLPAGYYELKAYLMNGGTSNGTLAANDASTSFQASAQYSVMAKLENEGTLAISATGAVTGSTWFCVDGFTLAYLGTAPLALFQSQLAEAVAAANTHADAISIPAAARTAYKNAISAAAADNATVDACLAGIDAIAAATTTADAMVNPYNQYIATKAAVEALDDDATVFTGSATIDVTAADAAVEAATTVDGINAAIDQLRTAAATFMAAVTLNEGKRFDITNIYLTNPDFEVSIPSGQMPPGWNITITGQNLGQQNRTDTNPETGLAITNFIEAWHPSQLGNGVIAQTVSSLPEGTYVLECDASICHDPAGADDITGANLFVQSSLKKEVSDPISNVRLYIKHYDVTFSHGGSGSVTFGLEANNTNANWLSADNFKVYFAGGVDLSVFANALAIAVYDFEALESVSDATDYATYKATVDANNKTWSNSAEYQAAIDAVHAATADLQAVNAAKAALAAAKDELAKAVTAAAAVEGTVPAAAYAALDAVVTEQNKTYDTTDEYNDATSAINTAITAATALKPNYDAFKTLKASANDLVAVDNDNNTANGELTNAISAANTAVEAATDADAIATATTGLKAAMVTYAGAANPVGDGAQFDLTFMLTNPDLTNCAGWAPADGWYNDQTQPSQNSQVMNSNQAVANTADPTKYAFYEYWSNDTEATEGFTVYQKVTLPEGTYKMTALAVAGYGGGHRYGKGTDDGGQPGSVSSEDHKNITFSAGETDGTQITTTTLEDASIEFINDQTQEVKIGLKAHAGNTSNWMGIGYVQLFKVPAAAVVTIDEDVDFTPVDVAANVELKRTFVADKWNTFVVPFAITNAELKAAFGDNVAVAEYSDGGESANAAAVNFNTMDTPSILANRPVLIKVETNATEFSFTGKTMAAAKFAPGTYYTFVGNYAANFQIPENNYFISGDKLWKSAGATTIKGTRAYLAVRNPNASTEVKLFIDGVETGINEIADNPVENGAIFNLAGQRVNKAQKGIFIINGKKVIK